MNSSEADQVRPLNAGVAQAWPAAPQQGEQSPSARESPTNHDSTANADTLLALLMGHARACLAEVRQAGETRPEAVLHENAGWTILLTVFPTPTSNELPGLTECDRACLVLLAQAQEPLSGYRARKELERRQFGIFGLATVKRSLARLKRLGLICNSRRRPRGYALPSTLPLFLHREP
jgi:hypothetical protein